MKPLGKFVRAFLNLGGAGMRPPHFQQTKNLAQTRPPTILSLTKNVLRITLYIEVYIHIYTREKIQQGWKEKGAPFRSGGAKRRIQGV